MYRRNGRRFQSGGSLGPRDHLEWPQPKQFAELLPGDGRDNVVETARLSIARHNAKETVAVNFQPLDPRAGMELYTTAGKPIAGALPRFRPAVSAER